MLFPVVIHKEPTSDYSVTIPDMPGCFTAGKTLEDAVLHIQDAAECHYSGESVLPIASPLERWLNDPDYEGGTWLLVDVDLSRINIKAKRVNSMDSKQQIIPPKIDYKWRLWVPQLR